MATATKAKESATLKALRVKLAKIEAENKELKARPEPKGKEVIEPGFKQVEHNPKYEDGKYQRTLESGNVVMWIIRKKKGNSKQWLDCQIDLRFKNGKAIPGFGGDEDKWVDLDTYFAEGGYAADRNELSLVMGTICMI